MRPQKVSVDVWKMIFSSCTYLGLAFMAWIFLKLVNACFWLPKHLKEQERQEELERQLQLENKLVLTDEDKAMSSELIEEPEIIPEEVKKTQ